MRHQLYNVATGYGSYAYVADDYGNYEEYTLAEALELTGYDDVDTAFANGIYIEPVDGECDMTDGEPDYTGIEFN